MLQLTEAACHAIIEERHITVIDVLTLTAEGEGQSSCEVQLQKTAQATWEAGESASIQALGIKVFATTSRDFSTAMLRKDLFSTAIEPLGFMLVGKPTWAGGSAASQTTSNQIGFKVVTPGQHESEANWAALRSLALSTVISVDEKGSVALGGRKVLVCCSLAKATAKQLKVCPDCMMHIEKGCTFTCKHYESNLVSSRTTFDLHRLALTCIDF